MKAISKAEIIALISDINAFADQAETLIATTRETYEHQKGSMIDRYKRESAALKNTFQSSCDAVRQQSRMTIQKARNIQNGILQLEDQLSAADKY